MATKTGKLVYISCVFSSMLGILLCGAIITADKLSSDLTSNLIQNQLVKAEQDTHQLLESLHEQKTHRV